jgi:hypothetical protein
MKPRLPDLDEPVNDRDLSTGENGELSNGTDYRRSNSGRQTKPIVLR